MRGAACLLMVVLTVGVCGCSGSSTAGRDCSGGNVVGGDHCVAYTLDQKAALALAQMPVPPDGGKPLTHIDCHVTGQVAGCSGVTQAGRRVQAKFKLTSTSPGPRMLMPICKDI